MRYITYDYSGEARLGVLAEGMVTDIRAALPDGAKTMRDVIAAGPAAQERIRAAVADPATPLLPVADCRLLSPLADPGKIICLGLNYAEHAKEGGHALPDYPALFLRCTTSMIGPEDPMVVPGCSYRLDYEAELVIVIGKRCRNVRAEDAAGVIFGYTAFNDGSIRDYQRRSSQWTAGKNFEGTGALGPWIVTADALPPLARGLGIRTRLNGQVMQDSNTDFMIFDVARTIEILSEIMTLEPGDLIATGTPNGVGHARDPQVWMRPGDRVEIEIDGIGTLANPIVAEPAAPVMAMAEQKRSGA